MTITRNEHGNPAITIELIANCDIEEAVADAIGRKLSAHEVDCIMQSVMASACKFKRLEEEAWDTALEIATETAREIDEMLVALTENPRTEPELVAWFSAVDSRIMAAATEWPATWGGQFRVSDRGEYISQEAMNEILDEHKLLLYYAMCANSERPEIWPLSEIAAHADDDNWLGDMANEYIDAGGTMFYTETFPDDYSIEELAGLLDGRPDLADETWPEVTAAQIADGLNSLEAECTVAQEPDDYPKEEER